MSDMAQSSLDVGVSPRVSVRFPPDLLAALDSFISPTVPSRSDVVRLAVQVFTAQTPVSTPTPPTPTPPTTSTP